MCVHTLTLNRILALRLVTYVQFKFYGVGAILYCLKDASHEFPQS